MIRQEPAHVGGILVKRYAREELHNHVQTAIVLIPAQVTNHVLRLNARITLTFPTMPFLRAVFLVLPNGHLLTCHNINRFKYPCLPAGADESLDAVALLKKSAFGEWADHRTVSLC